MSKNRYINIILSGEVTRDTDEKYAGGFWDAAADLLDYEFPQEAIYNMLWEVYETALAKARGEQLLPSAPPVDEPIPVDLPASDGDPVPA